MLSPLVLLSHADRPMSDPYPMLFDVRKFGARAEYENIDNPGLNNTPAFQDAFDAAAQAGGLVWAPPEPLGWWFESDVRGENHGIHLRGSGRLASRFYFEPEEAMGLFKFSTPYLDATATAGNGTLYACSAADFSVRGAEYVPLPGRHRKDALVLEGSSEFHVRNIDVNFFKTGADNYSAEGPSRIRLAGKDLTTIELCTLFTDRPLSVEPNPKERLGGAGPIDSDLLHVSNVYSAANATEANIHFDPDLIIRQFLLDGNNCFAGGLHGVHWDDPAGGAVHADGTFFIIKGLRAEQLTPGGWTVWLSRRGAGGAFMVSVEDTNLCFGSGGIGLAGTKQTMIRNTAYLRYTDQSTSPPALQLAASCRQTILDGFFVPLLPSGGADPGADLLSLTGQTVVSSSGVPGTSMSQVPAYMVLDGTP